ncbi:hypothetical protein ACQUY5_24540 [Bacillus cereus]|uniref:hypothetical protein n=1 Tax=Bacillus cereus TaxID=1396 RepID=UPI003D1630EB
MAKTGKMRLLSEEAILRNLNHFVGAYIQEKQVHEVNYESKPFNQGKIGESTVHDGEENFGRLESVELADEGELVILKLEDGSQSVYDLSCVTKATRLRDFSAVYFEFDGEDTYVEIARVKDIAKIDEIKENEGYRIVDTPKQTNGMGEKTTMHSLGNTMKNKIGCYIVETDTSTGQRENLSRIVQVENTLEGIDFATLGWSLHYKDTDSTVVYRDGDTFMLLGVLTHDSNVLPKNIRIEFIEQQPLAEQPTGEEITYSQFAEETFRKEGYYLTEFDLNTGESIINSELLQYPYEAMDTSMFTESNFSDSEITFKTASKEESFVNKGNAKIYKNGNTYYLINMYVVTCKETVNFKLVFDKEDRGYANIQRPVKPTKVVKVTETVSPKPVLSNTSEIPVKDFINNKELVEAVNTGKSNEGYITLQDVELRIPISALKGIEETGDSCLLSFHIAQTLDIKINK